MEKKIAMGTEMNWWDFVKALVRNKLLGPVSMGHALSGLSGKLIIEETGVAEKSSVCSLSYNSLKGPQGHFFWRYFFLEKKL